MPFVSRRPGNPIPRRPLVQPILAAITALGLAGCIHRSPAVELSTDDSTLNSRWHANLASPAYLAGAVQMNGSASMAPHSGGSTTEVTINLANAAPGGVHPWEAHYGQCGDGMDRGVFGQADSYPLLKVASDGLANGSATVAMETPRSGSYFVVIRASEANRETIVACGNLAPPTR